MSAASKLPYAPPTTAQEGPRLQGLPHTPGFADGFGDRQLVFDPASSTAFEVLRFKPEFAASPEFEAYLRARVKEVSHVHHPSLATIHSVERDGEDKLCLISKHTPGRRVSELLPKAHGPKFALELIRLVTPALAALERVGEGISHGAISAERIVVTRDGRLVLAEHVLGSAIETLQLSKEKKLELGIVVTGHGSDKGTHDGRTDISQLAFVALSLLLGRRLDAVDYPDKVPTLLDEFARTGSPMLAAKLRTWLERAMQISARPFACARDAHAAFDELPDDLDIQAAVTATGTLVDFPAEVSPAPRPNQPPAAHKDKKEKDKDKASAAKAQGAASVPAPSTGAAPPTSSGKGGFPRWALWSIAALAVLVVGQGIALLVLPYTRPAADVVELRPTRTEPVHVLPVPVIQAPAPGTSQAAVAPQPAPEPPPSRAEAPPPAAPALPPASAGPRFGGLTITAALELQVFEGGTLLGSTGGPIALNEGAHSIEFVNDVTGFRLRQTVTVKPGQMSKVNIALPNGRISIKAVPWADVDIDGTPAGQTPIANHSLPIGSHEITFRHPQHGVKRQTVIVKVEGLTRVTQTLGSGGQR